MVHPVNYPENPVQQTSKNIKRSKSLTDMNFDVQMEAAKDP